MTRRSLEISMEKASSHFSFARFLSRFLSSRDCRFPKRCANLAGDAGGAESSRGRRPPAGKVGRPPASALARWAMLAPSAWRHRHRQWSSPFVRWTGRRTTSAPRRVRLGQRSRQTRPASSAAKRVRQSTFSAIVASRVNISGCKILRQWTRAQSDARSRWRHRQWANLAASLRPSQLSLRPRQSSLRRRQSCPS